MEIYSEVLSGLIKQYSLSEISSTYDSGKWTFNIEMPLICAQNLLVILRIYLGYLESIVNHHS